MKPIHPVDARIAAQMLNLAADQFGNHGCNDFELPNTPENMEFIKRVIAWSDYPEDEPHLHADQILTMDWEVMRYCADVLEAAADGDNSTT